MKINGQEITDQRIQSFWSNVAIGGHNDCWEYGDNLQAQYPSVAIGGKKTIGAHQFAYIVTYGPIPSGMYVCHSCDNKHCVNPAHLEAKTQKENAEDAVRRGRYERGETWHKSHEQAILWKRLFSKAK